MRRLSAVSWLIAAAACTPVVQIEMIDTHTALERQILTDYRLLNEEMELIVSERDKARAPGEGLRWEALLALEEMEFNRADIETYKARGWLGEGMDGLLALYPRGEPQNVDAEQEALLPELHEQENRDRQTVMRYLIATNDRLTEDDLPRLQRVFARLQRETSPEGTWVQEEDGAWRRL